MAGSRLAHTGFIKEITLDRPQSCFTIKSLYQKLHPDRPNKTNRAFQSNSNSGKAQRVCSPKNENPVSIHSPSCLRKVGWRIYWTAEQLWVRKGTFDCSYQIQKLQRWATVSSVWKTEPVLVCSLSDLCTLCSSPLFLLKLEIMQSPPPPAATDSPNGLCSSFFSSPDSLLCTSLSASSLPPLCPRRLTATVRCQGSHGWKQIPQRRQDCLRTRQSAADGGDNFKQITDICLYLSVRVNSVFDTRGVFKCTYLTHGWGLCLST